MPQRPIGKDEPCYVISVVAKLIDLHPQTLRYYDKIGLLRPSRTAGRTRLYSPRDIEKLRKINRLTEDLGVNLAGVEVILNMSHRIEEMQKELARMQRQSEQQIQRLQQRIRELVGEEQERGSEVIEIIAIDKEQGQ